MSLERKMLLPPKKASGGLAKPAFCALLPLLVLACLNLGASKLLVLLIVGLPLSVVVFVIVGFSTARGLGKTMAPIIEKEAKQALEGFMTHAPLYIDTIMEADEKGRMLACGIAWDGESVYVLEAGEAVRIPWERVRSWHYHLPGSGPIPLYGNALEKTSQIASNTMDVHRARQNAGIFLTVADIEKPQWHVQTMKKAVCERWMEIFRQIQEGGLRR